jgi:hypothetical protein
MAEREQARVRFWRDRTGASAMSAYGLPTDAALAANAAINDRAEEYKKTKVRPGARMDQLRVLAFLDILNGITFQARAEAEAAHRASAAQPENTEAARRAEGCPDDGGPVSAPVGGPVSGMPGAPAPDAVLPALTARANLTVPLATLLGLAERPGAGHGLGPLDPALARDLARSRRCHKVKQSRGWTVTQPRPGWHQWKTPAGRTYTQGPMRYPA